MCVVHLLPFQFLASKWSHNFMLNNASMFTYCVHSLPVIESVSERKFRNKTSVLGFSTFLLICIPLLIVSCLFFTPRPKSRAHKPRSGLMRRDLETFEREKKRKGGEGEGERQREREREREKRESRHFTVFYITLSQVGLGLQNRHQF